MPGTLPTFFQKIFLKSPAFRPIGVTAHEEKNYLLQVNDRGDIFWLPQDRKTGQFLKKKRQAVTISLADGSLEDGRRMRSFMGISHHDGVYILTYVRKNDTGKEVVLQAFSKDFFAWRVAPKSIAPKFFGIPVSDYAHNGEAIMYGGDHGIHYSTSEDLLRWSKYKQIDVGSYRDSIDGTSVSLLAVELISEGILVVYDNSHIIAGNQTLSVGAMLFSYDDPKHVLWHSSEALYDPQRPSLALWEQFIPKREGGGREYRPLGVLFGDEKMRVYYFDVETNELFSIQMMQPFAGLRVSEEKAHLRRFEDGKHVLEPGNHADWGSVATFNAAALKIEDDVHLLYRAQGAVGLSVAGHVASSNPHHFPKVKDYPAYVPRMTFEGVGLPAWMRTGAYASGYAPAAYTSCAGWHGCEDPRLTRIGDTVYMIYAAYNGYEQARLAMTMISVEDFQKEQWNWSEPKLISRPPTIFGTGSKNGMLFPELINGKFVMLHRMWPNISIDYLDDLEFGEDTKWLIERDAIPPLHDRWDSGKIGAGAPPIKTKDGWLLIYQGVGSQDFRSHYKVGAMLVDLKDPAKVLYRSTHPILEPATWYELEGGLKPGVVYSCGAVVKGEELLVYYGASDTTTCLAKANLNEFLEDLKKDVYEEPVLRPVSVL